MASQKNSLNQSPKRLKPFNNYLKYSGLAIQMIITIGVMAYAGYKIDEWLGLRFPAFLLVFTFSALAGIIYWLIKSIEQDDEKE